MQLLSQGITFTTLTTEVFPVTCKMERKENPLKKSCQNPVEHVWRMMQENFRMRLDPNLFSGHFIRRSLFWPADMHTVHAQEWCEWLHMSTSLTSATSPISWTTYCAYSTGFWHEFFSSGFFSLRFLCARKNLCYQGTPSYSDSVILKDKLQEATILITRFPRPLVISAQFNQKAYII